MQRYDFTTDEACTYVKFVTMDDGAYVKYEEVAPLEQRIAELESQLKEKERLRNAATGSNAAYRYTIRMAIDMLDDPDYVMEGPDFDYEHQLHDKIRALHQKTACTPVTKPITIGDEQICSFCLIMGCNGECCNDL